MFKKLSIFSIPLLGTVLGSTIITALCYTYEPHLLQFTLIQQVTLYTLLGITMSLGIPPTTLICLLSGYFWGWSSLPLLIINYLIASTVGFYTGKKINPNTLAEFLKTKNQAHLLTQIQQNNFGLIVLTRLSPAMPFAFMNWIYASLNITYTRFITAGMIGMLPRTLMFFWIGTQCTQLSKVLNSSKEFPIQQISTIALIILTTVGIGYWVKTKLQKPTTTA